MKKHICCALLIFVASLFWSCQNNFEQTNILYSEELSQPNVIQELKNFNKSLKVSPKSRGLGWVGWLSVAIADSKGAYDGAKLGSKIGAILGPKGAAAGALIGGTIAGSGASFSQYEMARKVSEFSPYSLPVITVAPTQVTISTGYLQTKELIYKEDYELGISCGIDSTYVGVAIQHNLIMEKVESIAFEDIETLLNGELTDIESQIIYSDEYASGYDEIVSNPLECEIEPCNVTDQIMTLFIDAVYTACTDKADLNLIITNYTEATKNSKDLTETEKSWLYTGYAVMAYSFEYWSEEWPYEE